MSANDMDGLIEVLQIGLRTAQLRGRVISNNIANLNTPGFRRSAVAFDEALAEAISRGKRIDPSEVAGKLIEPDDTPIKANGNNVDLDVEVAEMVKNGAMYRTYVRMLDKLYDQMELAVSDRV
jgi:flagellar basal-body rod protein FlgB